MMRVEYSKGTMPPRNKKNFRSTKSGAGMTQAGVKAYRRLNPGSKLKTAVTGKVKPGSKAAKRRKSFCARSAGQMKKFPKAARDPNSRLRQARRRWKCQVDIRSVILQALEDRYNADISSAEATIKIYLEKPVGIGEHPQHLDEIDKLVDKIAQAEEKIKILQEFKI